jgi:hypothetical protein
MVDVIEVEGDNGIVFSPMRVPVVWMDKETRKPYIRTTTQRIDIPATWEDIVAAYMDMNEFLLIQECRRDGQPHVLVALSPVQVAALYHLAPKGQTLKNFCGILYNGTTWEIPRPYDEIKVLLYGSEETRGCG